MGVSTLKLRVAADREGIGKAPVTSGEINAVTESLLCGLGR